MFCRPVVGIPGCYLKLLPSSSNLRSIDDNLAHLDSRLLSVKGDCRLTT